MIQAHRQLLRVSVKITGLVEWHHLESKQIFVYKCYFCPFLFVVNGSTMPPFSNLAAESLCESLQLLRAVAMQISLVGLFAHFDATLQMRESFFKHCHSAVYHRINRIPGLVPVSRWADVTR